jgi:class 3 adenylate cyclase
MSPSMVETKLAIVLLDLIGSTRFVQMKGARHAAKWFQYHDRLTRSLCLRFEGREIDRSDGFLMSFNRPIDAVNFALEYQKTIPNKTGLGCRIGIHWGAVIEVYQDEKFVETGAKRVELEGLSKNIAARTMSLCMAGQVLLTKEAMVAVRNRTNMHTPKEARFVCVGLYRFKGVREPQELYAVGVTIESLQPPQGSDKVKRLGGPKYIKKRAQDRAFMDWVVYIYWRLGFIGVLIWLYFFIQLSFSPLARTIIGLPYHMPRYDAFIEFISSEVMGNKPKRVPKPRKRPRRRYYDD